MTRYKYTIFDEAANLACSRCSADGLTDYRESVNLAG